MKYKRIVRPEHLNHNGMLFGGYMLLWVDEYAYIAAIDEYPEARFVTRAMTAASFQRSIESGALLTFDVKRVHTGKTSVTYAVEVFARNLYCKEEIQVFQTQVTMCNLDKNGQKTQLPKLME